MFNNFFKGKKVLVTGHTGFKGSWLSIWLYSMGAEVIGVALEPTTNRDNFVLSNIGDRIAADIRADIRDQRRMIDIMKQFQPEIVFHLAAQPIVRVSYEKPVETYETNVMGTIHILEAIRRTPSVKVGVMVTTDKCYENREQIWGYRESEAMGGFDPYSSSKGAAELAIASWRNSYFSDSKSNNRCVSIASVRAGNVIGGGDWSVDRIIPDCIRSIESDEMVVIRNPKAIRPWQYVLEPLNGYLLLAMKMWNEPTKYNEAWNFGPNLESVVNVWELADKVVKCYGKGSLNILTDTNKLHEANLLMLDISKARFKLEWEPKLSLETTVEFVVEWYKNYRKSESVINLCIEQINKYQKQ